MVKSMLMIGSQEQELLFRADILRGAGFKIQQPKIPFSTNYKSAPLVLNSMKLFVKGYDSESVNNLVDNNLKGTRVMPTGNLLISAYACFDGSVFSLDGSRFVADGSYGFFLGKKERFPLWLAGVFFSSAQNDCPIIQQLQVVKHKYISQQELTLSTLQLFHWERALVYLVLDWAYINRFPAVYLQPAEMNQWVKRGNLPLERAKMRYDVTAERMGFRKDQNGLYALYLSYP